MKPFSPGATAKITVAATTARVALSQQRGPFQVRVCNLGSAAAWIAFGDGTVVATTSDMPIPAGHVEYFTVGDNAIVPYVAAIAAGTTGDIAFTIGRGGV